ncbi:MAG: CHAT domain-containing protein [Henriciella sp.]
MRGVAAIIALSVLICAGCIQTPKSDLGLIDMNISSSSPVLAGSSLEITIEANAEGDVVWAQKNVYGDVSLYRPKMDDLNEKSLRLGYVGGLAEIDAPEQFLGNERSHLFAILLGGDSKLEDQALKSAIATVNWAEINDPASQVLKAKIGSEDRVSIVDVDYKTLDVTIPKIAPEERTFREPRRAGIAVRGMGSRTTEPTAQRLKPQSLSLSRRSAGIGQKVIASGRTTVNVNNILRDHEAADFDGSRERFERILERPSTVDEYLDVKNKLAFLYYQNGFFSKAETLLTDLIDRNDKIFGPSDVNTLAALNNLSLLYVSEGRYEDAEALLDRVYAVANKDRSNYAPILRVTDNNLAIVYKQLGQYEAAAPLLQGVYDDRVSLYGDKNFRTRAAANNLAVVLLLLGRIEAAESFLVDSFGDLEQSLDIAEADDLIAAGNLATLFLEAKQYDRAMALFQKAIIGVESKVGEGQASLHLAELYSNYARTLDQAGYDPNLIAFYQKRSLNIIERIREDLRRGDAGNDTLFLDRYRNLYLDLQLTLIRASRFAEAESVGRLLKTHEYIEFMRGGIIPAAATAIGSELSLSENAWSQKLMEWSDRPNRIARELSALKAKQRSGAVMSANEQTLIPVLEAQYQNTYAAYKRDLNAWLTEVSAMSDSTQIIEANALEVRYHDDLQNEIAGIGDHVAVLQIVSFERSLHFFLITPNAFKHIEHPISRRSLNRMIYDAREALQPDSVKGQFNPRYKSILKRLHAVFIEPIEQELEDAEIEVLMLNLQGAIRYVPFAAIYDGERYLMQDYDLALFTPAARTRFRPSDGLREASAFGVAKAHQGFSPLPGVTKELATIMGTDEGSGILDGPKLLDEAFTKASLIEQLESKRPIVHIASHFYMRPGNDAQSFLLLGDGSYLSMAEINETAALRFTGVELLTLSACSTGLSSQGDYNIDLGSGLEVEGFGVLAQRKGADAVIATLWNVADEATSQLMAEMYRNLASDDFSKAGALRAAQIKLLADEATAHPYFWAPFILMGNWQ